MVSILLSTYDFNNNNCFDEIKKYIKPNMKVTICPFTHALEYYAREDLFDGLYNFDNGKDYCIIANAFHDYGIEKSNIYVLKPFRDTVAFMKHKIQTSDILFFTGGNPVSFMKIVRSLGLLSTLKEFKGITMGASAGAMVQLEEFMTYFLPWEHYPYRYFKGLGYVKGVDVVVHWEGNRWQYIAKIISYIQRKIPFLPIKDGFCMIFDEK